MIDIDTYCKPVNESTPTLKIQLKENKFNPVPWKILDVWIGIPPAYNHLRQKSKGWEESGQVCCERTVQSYVPTQH